MRWDDFVHQARHCAGGTTKPKRHYFKLVEWPTGDYKGSLVSGLNFQQHLPIGVFQVKTSNILGCWQPT